MPSESDDVPGVLVNERDTARGRLVSVCDADILGEHFENGDVSLTVKEDFYDGDPVDEQRVVESLTRCTVANIVGTRSVEIAVDHGFVDEDNVLDLEGTQHAQLLWL